MPGAETPGESGGTRSGATGGPGVNTLGVEHITRVLTTASGVVAASATEIFATAHIDRRRVTITNSDATAGQFLYVFFTNAVSATVYRWKLDAGDPPISIDCGPDVDIFLFGDAANTNYSASEECLAVA